jgi:tetratricopeptide (TPR) repeat protein
MSTEYLVPSTEYRVPGAEPQTRIPTRWFARALVLGTRYSVLGTLVLLASPLAAQTPLADSLWASGAYAAARTQYELSLHDNPGYVRALYRLAILASWDGYLDSALAMLRDAREVEPGDPDVRLWQAKVLAWDGRYPQALVRYDSLITEFPERRDPRFGRAETLAWSGRSTEAEHELKALVDNDPGDVEALVALGQLRLWQGRLREADSYNNSALRAAPRDRAAIRLQAQVRVLRRPRLEFGFGLIHDSDQNTAWWQTLGSSLFVAPGVRAFASVGAYEAHDPLQDATRLSGEAGATLNRGDASVTAALGVRKLASDLGADRSLGTWRVGASYRLTPTAGTGISYAHYSIDETAFLVGNDLDIDELSLDGDVELRRNLTLGFGGGLGYLSDDNDRRSAVVALTARLTPRASVGVFGRGLWYDFKGPGYFSPDHFLLGEIRGSYTHPIQRWEGKVSGGLGLQDSGTGGNADAEWHADIRIARRWATINEVALSGGVTNSALSSATGAFRYYTAGLSLRLGL